MRFIRRHLLAVAATMGLFAVAAPVSGASAFSWPAGWPSVGTPVAWSGAGTPVGAPVLNTLGGQAGSYGCGSNTPAGNGPAGGTINQACGGVLTFIGPSVGQISSVIGPTIIGSTVLAPVTVSAGPVAG
jgi:hypothetical protein